MTDDKQTDPIKIKMYETLRGFCDRKGLGSYPDGIKDYLDLPLMPIWKKGNSGSYSIDESATPLDTVETGCAWTRQIGLVRGKFGEAVNDCFEILIIKGDILEGGRFYVLAGKPKTCLSVLTLIGKCAQEIGSFIKRKVDLEMSRDEPRKVTVEVSPDLAGEIENLAQSHDLDKERLLRKALDCFLTLVDNVDAEGCVVIGGNSGYKKYNVGVKKDG